MHCHNCGVELPEGAKFCPECATPVESKQEPIFEDTQREGEPLDSRDAPAGEPEGKSNSKKRSSSRTARGFVIALAVLFVGGVVASNVSPGNFEELATPATSTSSEPTQEPTQEPIIWPGSLDQVTGLPSEELEFVEVCSYVSERILGLSMFESSVSKLKTLNNIDGPYDAANFVAENAWVSAAAKTNPRDLLEDTADDQLELYLVASDSSDWSQMGAENPALFSRLSTEVRTAILSNCNLEDEYKNVYALALKSKTTASQAADVPWYPDGFKIYSGDANVAWKWADRSCSYSSARCNHIDLVTKDGASFVYVEVTFLDSSGSYVDYSNDTARNLSAGQIAKLEFVTFSDSARSSQLSEISARR
tara:strand:- start:517 stop:1608 length:1092 start_codon:yes stop_codon:yes gene_type:complete